MSTDIVRELRSVPANMIGTSHEETYWLCHDAAAAIERLQAEVRALRAQLEQHGTHDPDIKT